MCLTLKLPDLSWELAPDYLKDKHLQILDECILK